MRLRHLDLFSGIGGFALGLEQAGLSRPVGFVEIDPFCQRVLAKHWPGVPIHDDVTTREFIEGEADVITGGFPCQDISLAGKRAGLSGSRSGLYRHVIRAIRVVRPKFAILENVAALLSGGMGDVLGDLAEVGYDAEWHCIPASAVGAPHRRDRVWIVANPRSEQHEGGRPPLGGEIAEKLSRAAADANEPGLEIIVNRDAGEFSPSFGARQWSAEPDICRVAYGISGRVDRLKALGNSVVPQVVEVIGRAIKATMESEDRSPDTFERLGEVAGRVVELIAADVEAEP